MFAAAPHPSQDGVEFPHFESPRMLLCFANRFCGRVGEPFLVSGGELVVVVEASFEEREEGGWTWRCSATAVGVSRVWWRWSLPSGVGDGLVSRW